VPVLPIRADRFDDPGKGILWIRDRYDRAALFAAITDPIVFGFEPLEIAMSDSMYETLRTAVVCQLFLFDGQVTAAAAQFCGLGWEQNQFLVFAW
jgi:hypothetical protein